MIRISFWPTGLCLLLSVAAPALPAGAPQHKAKSSACTVVLPSQEPPGTREPDAAMMTGDEWRFLELVNRERAARHLAELKPDPLLVEVAREHSREMCEKNYFDHISPTPGQRTPMERFLHAIPRRPAHACVGENLFYCSIVDVDRGHRALMNSPSHRENILYGPFRRGGIGIYKSATGEFWVTEMFLTTES